MSINSTPVVFVPGLGFRARDGLTLRAPVTVQQDEWNVTVDRLVSDRDGVQVALTIYGPFKWRPERHGFDLDLEGFVRARDPSGAVVSSDRQRVWPLSFSIDSRGNSVSCTANLSALPSVEDKVEIVIGEPLPSVTIPISLLPLSEFAIPARTIDVRDEHHGVVITAHAIGRGADMTAVLLHASLRPHSRQRFMRALGTFRDAPVQAPGVTMVDDTGTEITAFAAIREIAAGPEIRAVVAFPGLASEARLATVMIPYVVLSEHTGSPVTLSVPSEGEISLGDDRAFVRVARQTGPRGREAIGVEVNGRWHADRRMLYAESIAVDGHHGGVGFRSLSTEPPIQTYAEDSSGVAGEIALESPVLQLRGPWRLPVELP